MCISTQMLGFVLAGFSYRFLVTPAAMIWPSTLINTTLFTALHDRSRPDPKTASGWTVGKYRMFSYCMIGLNVITEFVVWYMQPGRPMAMMLFKTYGYISPCCRGCISVRT